MGDHISICRCGSLILTNRVGSLKLIEKELTMYKAVVCSRQDEMGREKFESLRSRVYLSSKGGESPLDGSVENISAKL